jgi:hypothetical protein
MAGELSRASTRPSTPGQQHRKYRHPVSAWIANPGKYLAYDHQYAGSYGLHELMEEEDF